MPDEIFKGIAEKSKLINAIYELISEHVNTGHGKINCIVALQSDKEVFSFSNVKNEEAVKLFLDMAKHHTPSGTTATMDYY